MRVSLCVAFVASLPWLCVGCGEESSCTALGCVNGFEIELQSSSNTWKAGTYEVQVDTGGEKIVCTAVLPVTDARNPPSTCTASDAMLVVSGSSQIPQERHAVENLIVNRQISSATITILLDGREFARQSFSPAYQKLTPNGEQCGPVCYHAFDGMTVP